MDALRLGMSLRALRIRRGWRQSDLSRACGVPRAGISEIERGMLVKATVDDLRRVAEALGALLDIRIRWYGEQLDRLLDEAHAATVSAAVAYLSRHGWSTLVEVSFSIWGERGSVDVLGWHAATRTLLVVEVKSVVPDLQATLRDLDRKTRLGPEIAAPHGWTPATVGRLLVVAESPTSRSRVRQHGAVLGKALPNRGADARAWLREPRGPFRGLLFLSNAAHTRTKAPIWRRERVRPAIRPVPPPQAASNTEVERKPAPDAPAPR